jgi:hypothetical protein
MKTHCLFWQAILYKKQKPHAPKIFLWLASHRAAHENAVSSGTNAEGFYLSALELKRVALFFAIGFFLFTGYSHRDAEAQRVFY